MAMERENGAARWYSLRRWGVRTRVLAAIGLVAVVTLVVGGVGLMRMSMLSDKAQDVYHNGTVPLDTLRSLQATWWELQAHSARVRITNLAPEFIKAQAAARDESAKSLAAQTEAAAGQPYGPQARADFESYRVAYTKYLDVTGQIDKAATVAAKNALVPQLLGAEVEAQEALSKATSAEVGYAEQTARDAEDAYRSARTFTLIVAGAGLLIGLLLALLVARSVIRPLTRIREVLDLADEGDLRERVEDSGRDELASVATSLDRMLDSLTGVLGLVDRSATGLAASSLQLSSTATAIAENTHGASGQALVISSAAEEVSSSVETVATGSEEMEAAIREIAANSKDAADVAATAVTTAEATTRTVEKLGESTQEIASVVKMITAIAEQTNLLALNATIEAARAGEAGKGFAVVASEVKELAQETARATEDISTRVGTIQADTSEAVQAIGEISQVVGKINDIQASIAAAVEQQTMTTNEMNRSMSGAADGSKAIAENISGMVENARQTETRLEDAKSAAAELARMSTDLQHVLSNFKL
ncbi:MAG TPA: methyl-accepting chemotaxis protein [Actinophytocola sp.]|uniref:methyl-accepting chemotaxis protein n=1 Tax=Actinophytocola sp. TaxID=1872138 RepID=UPI002DBCC57B|nr:methyl-accepting chemotaxis protein [Actinophytocola sp.]HEU5474177.1 methyl-accepting chemotaxis protein [Actinophytocola sp.]